MAGSHAGEAETDRDGGQIASDETLRYLSIAAASGFTLLVAAFLGVILAYFVDYGLLVDILEPPSLFLDAFVTVVTIVVVGSVLSIVAGVFVGLGRISNTRFTRAITRGYVEFFRGTPLLFQLIAIYYGIPALWATGEFPIQNWALPAAIIGLTLNHAAYEGEAIRGGIEAVPDGQMEAARSLGMSYVQAMREVILPQAWRNALAAIGNDLVILVKDTSLLTVIAVSELISAFQNTYSTTFDPWTPLMVVAVLYLLITIPLGMLVNYAEERADPAGESH